jgi:hypothetical protein
MLPPPEPRIVRTPWGELRPLVDLRPLWYLLILYGVLWFLPRPVFEFWRKGEDVSPRCWWPGGAGPTLPVSPAWAGWCWRPSAF